jgi:hypothetical protein
MSQRILPLALALATLAPGAALASDAQLGGYLRVATRPDMTGGDGRLGYWNLYGRLLNEGPYAALEGRVTLLEREPGVVEPWTTAHVKFEGGGVGNAEPGNGSLTQWRMSQLYVRAGNVFLKNVTWQLGTLDSYFGDLGLYDMRPAQIFFETVGVSGRYESDRLELLLGIGDSGYFMKGSEYNTIITPGGTARVRLGRHLEVGGGGQVFAEPSVAGNRYAPHYTPGIGYEDWLRGEVVESYFQENEGQIEDFPDPVPADARSWKVVGYLGFGGFGPLRWNNFYMNYQKLHPETTSTEIYQDQEVTLYISQLTDERYQLNIGNEMQLALLPERLDAVWGVLYGDYTDEDNQLAPSDHDRTFMSTVLRLQTYIKPTVHFLVEGSAAKEVSRNGNSYREHVDSIFTGTDGVQDSEGFEYGDTDTRFTFQGKGGFVLNPLGPGVYTRPSLRVLYGVQYSNQNNAFGNSFVETLDQYNEFGNTERHLHQVLALETEVWF